MSSWVRCSDPKYFVFSEGGDNKMGSDDRVDTSKSLNFPQIQMLKSGRLAYYNQAQERRQCVIRLCWGRDREGGVGWCGGGGAHVVVIVLASESNEGALLWSPLR